MIFLGILVNGSLLILLLKNLQLSKETNSNSLYILKNKYYKSIHKSLRKNEKKKKIRRLKKVLKICPKTLFSPSLKKYLGK